MATPDETPPLRLGLKGVEVRPSKARVAALRKAFARDGFVRLPSLFSPALLAEAAALVARARFRAAERSAIITVEGSEEPSVDYALSFLLQDPAFFAFVAGVTGCPLPRAFAGRLIRSRGGTGDFVGWHDDASYEAGRLASLTVNLSPGPYRGGVLQFRRPGEEGVRAEVANTGLGDAVLFEAREGEHRNTPLEEGSVKTAFAGWFYADRNGRDGLFLRERRTPGLRPEGS